MFLTHAIITSVTEPVWNQTAISAPWEVYRLSANGYPLDEWIMIKERLKLGAKLAHCKTYKPLK